MGQEGGPFPLCLALPLPLRIPEQRRNNATSSSRRVVLPSELPELRGLALPLALGVRTRMHMQRRCPGAAMQLCRPWRCAAPSGALYCFAPGPPCKAPCTPLGTSNSHRNPQHAHIRITCQAHTRASCTDQQAHVHFHGSIDITQINNELLQ